jgi:tRNA threonylcarbamoyladenosine biosynthesis protein TsaE
MSSELRLRYDLKGIHTAAQQFWNWARPQRIISFSGGLGAGKTTFVHALCDALQITDPVSSPTFALINEYALPAGNGEDRILHMDWYRLRDADEAVNAGMEDALLSEDAVCFIEWPEQAPELLEQVDHIAVTITTGDAPDDRVLDARIVSAL